MSSSLLDVISYYQRSIEKNGHDEKRLLHCIEKLYKLPVKLEHLQSTGVGKTVNSLRKYDKEVGVAAKALVAKWKAMVAAEVPHEDEDDDLTRESQDDDDDDDQSENSQNRDNTQMSNQNGRTSEEQRSNSTHHSKHGEHHLSSSSSSKDKHRNGRDSDRQSSRSSEHGRSHNSHSSSGSKHKYEDHKLEKRGHNSSRRDEKARHKHAENSKEIKEPDSDSEEDDRTDRKLSIVEEIEQDFEIDDDDDEEDDDDDEKLIIDVSKEKTDEIEKRSKSESQELPTKHRHHSNKDTSRYESKHGRDNSKKSSNSKERSPKTTNRSKERSSKESSHSSRDISKKENSSKESSRSERYHSKDKLRKESHHSKESSRLKKEDSPRRDKYKEKESSVEKRERKEDRTHSDSHKSKHTEKERDSRKEHKEKQSSSSHKHRHKDKDKEGEKEKEREKEKEKEVEKSAHKSDEVSSSKRKNSDSDSKSSESSPVKAKVPKLLVDGIDSSMGTSFEEALGMITVSKGSKNSSKKSPKAGTSSSSGSSSGIFAKPSSRSPIESKTPPLLTPTAKLEPLDPSIALELPTISPNYKPLPLNPTVMECVFSQNKPQKRLLTDEEALHQGISSKTIRTKVYSGVKLGVPQIVPTLFDLCIRVLQKNIDALEYTGGVPFEVLKQVLERATPTQLLIFEEYNPYLMEDSDVLWKQHCMRFYRGQKRQEMETWREMYLRCKDEQDRKLSMLAENIKQSQKIIQQPIRKTQLAYVDSMVKPPRNIMKKQEQYGTKSNLIATPAARVASLANITPNVSKIGDARLKASARAPDTVQIAVAPTNNGRPKKAPLMQKTINFMKGRFKR